MRQLDRAALERVGKVDEIEAAIANGETAFRMQAAVPELMDLTSESNATKELYGVN